MYGLGGMWVFSLVLVLPLLIGVASASKRVYQFLIARGVSRNNALTASVVGLIMLAGIMSSPLFLGALPLRMLAGASYLYFLFVGGRTIVNFFTGGGSDAKGEAQPGEHHHAEGEDCGCDHGGHGKHDGAHGKTDAAVVEPTEPQAPTRPATPPPAPKRSAAELRAEIERRIAESEGKKGPDEK